MNDVAKRIAECPECGSTIRFRKSPYMGQNVSCNYCETELVVVNVSPIELDWSDSYDYDEEDWDDWEDEDDED